ncbi:uncharacterized protein BJX67DRAFT_358880 [Aspergillus lucknowensis]|uniref:Uncharacterized protein n=1 Tax=Aspergillus lucknowensis TaxID=176173 RepID=A0ABR4LLL9_9EURO
MVRSPRVPKSTFFGKLSLWTQESGVYRDLLRSTTEAGKVTLRVISDGLESVVITLSTKSICVKNRAQHLYPW